MLLHFGPEDYTSRAISLSRSVEELESSNPALEDLQAQGVDYVHIGQRGDFSGPRLQAEEPAQSQAVDMV
jgi:hypothetical protein